MNRFIHEHIPFRNSIDHFRISVQCAIECHCLKLKCVVTLIGECFVTIRDTKGCPAFKCTEREQNEHEILWKAAAKESGQE